MSQCVSSHVLRACECLWVFMAMCSYVHACRACTNRRAKVLLFQTLLKQPNIIFILANRSSFCFKGFYIMFYCSLKEIKISHGMFMLRVPENINITRIFLLLLLKYFFVNLKCHYDCCCCFYSFDQFRSYSW